MTDVRSEDALPKPRPWPLRVASMPWLGPNNVSLPRLRHLLESAQSNQDPTSIIRWPDGGGETTLQAAISSFGSSGIFQRSQTGAGMTLSADAAHWLATGDDLFLVGVFHAHVRYVGELLAELENPLTHDQLRSAAESKYALSWTTNDQVYRRTRCLRDAGLVELWTNNLVVRTELGKQFLSRLTLASPQEVLPDHENEPERDLTLTDPTPGIAHLLASLTQDKLWKRYRGVGFIPGGDPLTVLQKLVSMTEPKISRADFEQICMDEFTLSLASAKMVLGTLRSAGLIEQVGRSTYAATGVAKEWLETNDPLDLVRIFHAHFVFMGELLFLLDRHHTVGALKRAIETTYATEVSLTTDELARRVRILQAAGLVRSPNGHRHYVKPLGTMLLATLPVMTPTGGSEAEDEPATAGEPSEDREDALVPALRAASLAHELVQAATNTANTTLFEQQICAALNFLGFQAQHVGGPGKPDVLVKYMPKPGEWKLIALEAKTSAAGVLSDLNFQVLDDHKRAYRADKTVVVAPAFEGRVIGWAESNNVVLVTASELAKWIERHGTYPILRHEVPGIFEAKGRERLESLWSSTLKYQRVLMEVATLLWRCANSAGHVAKTGGALTARELWLMMSASPEIDEEEISNTLQLLASPLIAAVRATGGGFMSCQSPDETSQRLRFIADSLGGADRQLLPAPSERREREMTRRTPLPLDLPESAKPSADTSTIRRWAIQKGIQVNNSGRLPKNVIDRYHAERD